MRISIPKQLRSLTFSLTIFTVLAAFLCFFVNDLFTVHRAYDSTVKYTHYMANVSLQSAVNALDARLEKVELATQAVAKNSDLITDDPNSSYELLNKLLDYCPYISAATIMFKANYYPQIGYEYSPSIIRTFMADEKRVNSTTTGFSYLSQTNIDGNWLVSSKGKCFWSVPYRQSSPPHDVRVAYSVPMYDRNGNIFAVLCSTIETKWVYEEIRKAIFNENAQVRVMHKSGYYFCHPDSTYLMLNADSMARSHYDMTAISILSRMESSETGFMQIGSSMNYYAYFAPLKRANWSVAISFPVEDIFHSANELTTRMIWINVGIIILLLIVLPFGIYYIVKPYMIRFKVYAEESASLDRDLLIASRLQTGILPSADELSNTDRVHLACQLKPAKMVGGDLYDFFIRENRLFVCIGDVSGKGVPAALFMAIIRTMFRDITQYEASPEAIISALNNSIMQKNPQCMFCTMFVAVLNLDTGVIEYCNAGHNPPIVAHTNENGTIKTEYLPESESLPIGVLEDGDYVKDSITMQSKDLLFLYTDGVTEAENSEKHLFGEQQTLNVISDNSNKDADTVLDCMYETIINFSAGVEQSDDICMVAVKMK